MSVGLEGRVPLLDHALVELAESIPTAWHFQGGTKSILRELLAKLVPSVDFDRPKAGFGIPIDEWLRGPLRDWAESLLTPIALEDAGLCPVTVGESWKRLQAGRPVHHQVWTVLMYLAWRRRWQG